MTATATQLVLAGRLTVLDGGAGTPAPPVLREAPILANGNVGDRYWRMRIEAPEIAAQARPGQFLMATVARPARWDPALPRPMAIFAADAASGTVDFVYGVVGRGTRQLSRFAAGERLTVVGPLGRGFAVAPETRSVLLIGRGIGTCSLTALALEAVGRGLSVGAVDSARHPGALVGRVAYERLGVEPLFAVHDADGSSDAGAVESLLRERLSDRPPEQVFVCGSRRLLEVAGSLARAWNASVQVSVEAHMACGLGYCHGCSSGLRTAAPEAPLVCRDGPVFAWER